MSMFSNVAIGSGGATLVAGGSTAAGGLLIGAGALDAIERKNKTVQKSMDTFAGSNTWNGYDTYAGAILGSALLPGAGAILGLIGGGLIGSKWGSTKTRTWDNSKKIAQTRAKESEKHQVVQKTVGDILTDLGINKLSKAYDFLIEKGEENNTITQTTRTKRTRWWGASSSTSYSNRYWQELTDQLLQRYGFETYAQKTENLRETLDWMKVKDMDKLGDDTYIVDIEDVEGQKVERDIASSRMRDYFGNQYVGQEQEEI